MNFLLVSAVAYIFNAGALLVDKILLKKSFPNPIVYTFYVNILQLFVLLLIPFGFHFNLDSAAFWAIISGIVGVGALYAFFSSLRVNDASTVGPIVGVLNPLFALILGGLFLHQILTSTQYLAFFILLIGALVLTFNLWGHTFKFGTKFIWMALAGFLFGLSYVLLREAFLHSSFINGLIFSRVAAGLIALIFLLFPNIRKDIFASKSSPAGFSSRATLILMGLGQIMGAASGLLITFGVSLASPALINSLFGVQYLTILVAALFLAKKHPQLLGEHLSKKIVVEKLIGAVILSIGLYLLAR